MEFLTWIWSCYVWRHSGTLVLENIIFDWGVSIVSRRMPPDLKHLSNCCFFFLQISFFFNEDYVFWFCLDPSGQIWRGNLTADTSGLDATDTYFLAGEGTPRLMLRAGSAPSVMPGMEVQRKNTAAALAEKKWFLSQKVKVAFYVLTVAGLPWYH